MGEATAMLADGHRLTVVSLPPSARGKKGRQPWSRSTRTGRRAGRTVEERADRGRVGLAVEAVLAAAERLDRVAEQACRSSKHACRRRRRRADEGRDAVEGEEDGLGRVDERWGCSWRGDVVRQLGRIGVGGTLDGPRRLVLSVASGSGGCDEGEGDEGFEDDHVESRREGRWSGSERKERRG